MAHVDVHHDDISLSEPILVEGLPGVGLVGKIAADHLVEQFEMDYYAAVHCEGLPEVAVYAEDERNLRPPVRLYAAGDRDLLVLQSDVPVNATAADEFATCLTGWFLEEDVTPIYLSGLPEQKDGVPELYGVASNGAGGVLDDQDIDTPPADGVISGPTGELLAAAETGGLEGLGLIVQANQRFPDPEGARVLLSNGIGPVADVEVDTEPLVEQAEEIAEARENLARQMQQAEEESTRAQPVGMFQ
jgi:uncharacterized protein